MNINRNQILSTAIGAGVGAGTGYVATRKAKNKRKKIAAIAGGAVLGGGAGFAGHKYQDNIKDAYNKVKGKLKFKKQSMLDDLVVTRFYADTPAVRNFCAYYNNEL